MDKSLYSVIDASINRATEGLRVCEDLLRFHYRLGQFSEKLKFLRHNVVQESSRFTYSKLLEARDVSGDTQKFVEAGSDPIGKEPELLMRANMHRALEALRTLEEMAKLNVFSIKTVNQSGNPFQEIRFSLYQIEKEVMTVLGRVWGKDRLNNSLYVILDPKFVNGSFESAALRCINGGASVLQLRMKGEPAGKVLQIARALTPLCREHNVLFIINDHPEIACLAEAGGVHLGQDDLSIEDARSIVPDTMLVGISTHTSDQALIALESEPDYIAIGPLFGTSSKGSEPVPAIGIDTVSLIRKKTDLPIVGIGGITPENASACMKQGCNSLAVISFVFSDNNLEENCSSMVRKIQGDHE